MKMIWINKLLLIITLILLYSMNMIIGCMKSSMFYRTPTRTRSHVFTPGEYQPKQIESNLEASGPLDTRDFHYQLPTKRLVRVDSPHILFDSEEARWMTKGCRDRLIKLSTQIQNTWAKQEVVLRVIRSWVKPPPNYKPLPTEDINKEDTDDGDSLLLYEKNLKPEKNSHNHEPVFVEQPSTVFSGQRSLPFGSIKSKPYLDAPIIDMTPEMIEDQFPQSNSDSMKKMRSQSNGLKFLHYIPSSTQKNRWYSTKNHLNYLPSYSSSTKQSLSVYPIHSQRVYQSPPPSSSAASVNVYNSYKVSSSLPDTSYNTMIRLPRNVISRLSNKTGNNTLLINNISSSNSLKRYTLHKIVERSVNTMYAPNIDRKNYNYNPNNKQKYLQNTIIMNELRMEEFHYAGRAVDIELTTRQYNRPHNVNLHLGVLAQIAYYVAHFDWCFFNRAGHVHCSVKPDSIVTSQWFGCFPGESKVHKANGELISIKDLQIGDRIITQHPENGLLTSTLVFGFLDRDEHAWSPLTEIIFQIDSNKNQYGKILLTEDHLIFIHENSTICCNNPNGDAQIITQKAIFASSVQNGQTIFIHYGNDSTKLIKAQVISVQTIKPIFNDNKDIENIIGLYAPITDSGTLIVNNVLVSCFAHISNHNLASIIIWPWKLAFIILSNLYSYITWFGYTEDNEIHSTCSIGVPWYIQWIYSITHTFLPDTLFYKSINILT